MFENKFFLEESMDSSANFNVIDIKIDSFDFGHILFVSLFSTGQ